MRISSAKIALAALAGVLSLGALGIGTTYAASKAGVSERMSGLVSAIAQKFNLDPAAVQSVFDAQIEADRAAMEAEHAAKAKAFLDQAVKDGKLTQAQADAIAAKQAELKSLKPDFAGKTKEEIMAAMKAQKEELSQWAKENGIPEEHLRFGQRVMMIRKGEPGKAMHFFAPGMKMEKRLFLEKLPDPAR